MQAWYHCENVYPFVPQEVLDRAESVRASLPNRYCDPKIAADLFHECLDEHLLCDDLGVNIVSIEHHSGINSLYGASTMILGIIARQTKNVRILSLGTLVSVLDNFLEMKDVDVHDRGEGLSTKEKYVMEVRRFGVKPNRREVSVRKHLIIGVSKLEDVLDY